MRHSLSEMRSRSFRMCSGIQRFGVFALVCAAAVVGATNDEVLVTVPGLGDLLGIPSKANGSVILFKGVPYAQPPTGTLRWSPPRPYGPWESPRDATSFGSECFQVNSYTGASQSEDCLFLNVATPVSAIPVLATAKRLPVIAYIHGGAYTSGSANNIAIDFLVAAANLAVIVVSIEYRLNVFGFLGSSELRERSASGSTGNYGIEDQRLALSWIRDHIGAFGGDGQQITIVGESAGGNSVFQHMTQPASFGLYDKAIIESGAYNGSVGFHAAQRKYDWLLSRTRCADVLCLQDLSAQRLLKVARSSTLPFGPVVDEVSLQDYPLKLLSSGRYNRQVPVILGSNRDEAAYSMYGTIPSKLTGAELEILMRLALPCLDAAARRRVKEIYDPSNYTYPTNLGEFSQAWWTVMRMSSDGSCMSNSSSLGPCTVRRVARALVKGGTPSVFTYVFAHPSQKVTRDMNEKWRIPFTGPGNVLVAHAMELPYVFHFLPELSVADGEAKLSLAMASYWSDFATNGFVHAPGLPHWPPFNSTSETVMRFEAGDGGIRPQIGLRQEACDFWDAYADEPFPKPWEYLVFPVTVVVICCVCAALGCALCSPCWQKLWERCKKSKVSGDVSSPFTSSFESEDA
eukprot:TRINITY_DN29164_c0_g1_i2.p1 TRINITY_DN29164_c0_g1~~TRINITY_DN29164_c0_g1_i2.p1  ORF type:complete len:630 (+),score=53.79 TRINITY_DN29164_c0_g1_i2:59-1948(+)